MSIENSLKFVPKDPVNNKSALVHIMAWRQWGAKPLSAPILKVTWRYMALIAKIVRFWSRLVSMNIYFHVVSFLNDDVIKWKHFPRYWLFVRVIHRLHAQSSITLSFDVFFDLLLNKRLSKQSWCWWFETPWHSFWRHCKCDTETVCAGRWNLSPWRTRTISSDVANIVTPDALVTQTAERSASSTGPVFLWWRHQMETFSALLALCAGNSPVNSPYKGQWRGTLMFPLICDWINGWINNREAGDLRHHRDHYDVTAMWWRFVDLNNEALLYQQVPGWYLHTDQRGVIFLITQHQSCIHPPFDSLQQICLPLSNILAPSIIVLKEDCV